jgi:large subunit ribosomal protein L30
VTPTKKSGKTAAAGTLRVTQVKSEIGYDRRQRKTLLGLGLRGVHKTVELPANDAVRGMIDKVRHLVKVEG